MVCKAAALIVGFAFLAGLPGCAPHVQKEQRGTVSEHIEQKEAKIETAAMGGYLGKLNESMIGHHTHDKKKGKDETAKKYKYRPSQGILAKIENVSVVPREVKAGQTVEIRMTYAVLGTTPRRELTVTETREIRYKGEIVGKPVVHLACEDGTYFSTLPVTLPPDSARGKYKVVMTIRTHKVTVSKETFFHIK